MAYGFAITLAKSHEQSMMVPGATAKTKLGARALRQLAIVRIRMRKDKDVAAEIAFSK